MLAILVYVKTLIEGTGTEAELHISVFEHYRRPHLFRENAASSVIPRQFYC